MNRVRILILSEEQSLKFSMVHIITKLITSKNVLNLISNILMIFFLFASFISCEYKKTANMVQPKIEIVRMIPSNIAYSDQLEDSINTYKLKMDEIIEKYIKRLSNSEDSSAKEMRNILLDYKTTYKHNIDHTGRLIYLASGLNKDNFSNQQKMEYYSIIVEYEKMKAILPEISGNYIESERVSADSINGVPSCLYEF